MAEIHEVTHTGERRRAREYALQILSPLDLAPRTPSECLDEFWRGKNVKAAVTGFVRRLVLGAMEHRDSIDGVLTGISHHWRVSRMAVVDRNVLRLALYEMFFEKATPPVVVINEAIEVAKKFGDDESGPFINGILDAVRLRLERNEIDLPGAEAGGPGPSLRSSA